MRVGALLIVGAVACILIGIAIFQSQEQPQVPRIADERGEVRSGAQAELLEEEFSFNERGSLISELEDEVTELKQELAAVGDEVSEEADEEAAEARLKLQELENTLEDAKDATEDEWDALVVNVKQAYRSARDAVSERLSRAH